MYTMVVVFFTVLFTNESIVQYRVTVSYSVKRFMKFYIVTYEI